MPAEHGAPLQNLSSALCKAVYQHHVATKDKVQRKLHDLQQERCRRLQPGLFLPGGWEHVLLAEPVVLYMVVAAVQQHFVSVKDGALEFRQNMWTFARSGTSAEQGWPPLWSCMAGAYTDIEQARRAKIPKGSKHAQGAKVLIRVTAKGKAYHHAATGQYAVSKARTDALLDYLTAPGSFLQFDESGVSAGAA